MPMAEIEVNKRFLWIAAGIFLVMIITFLAVRMIPEGKKKYSEDPRDWINAKGNKAEVSVDAATSGESYQDMIGQQYATRDFETVFSHDGVYLGEYFENEYIKDGKTLIRFTKDIIPSDNIPDGFIMERYENEKMVAYIFVDDDWKKKIGETNIIWGEDYEKVKPFAYKNLENGIYYDKVDDDMSRFSEDFKVRTGGILVGRITKLDIEETRKEDKLKENIIYLRLT
jgi:hypothetical protein